MLFRLPSCDGQAQTACCSQGTFPAFCPNISAMLSQHGHIGFILDYRQTIRSLPAAVSALIVSLKGQTTVSSISQLTFDVGSHNVVNIVSFLNSKVVYRTCYKLQAQIKDNLSKTIAWIQKVGSRSRRQCFPHKALQPEFDF